MATNEQLQAELADLREEMRQLREALAATQAVPVASEPRLLSRRNLLRAAPVAAVGGAIAAMSASPAAAATGDPILLGKPNDAGVGHRTDVSGGTPHPDGQDPTWIPADQPSALSAHGGLASDWLVVDGVTVGVQNQGGAFVDVRPPWEVGEVAAFVAPAINDIHLDATSDGISVAVTGATAIFASVLTGGHESETLGGVGLRAEVQLGVGVDATATDGVDAFDQPVGGVALSGKATTGAGVHAEATEGHAIEALTTSTTTNNDAVTIEYAGKSRALWAESTSPTNINGTITGVNAGNGIGVWGEQRGTGAGFGLVGVAGKAGRGAQVTGGAAQLRMVPSTASTHPTTGKAGDFFVDAANRLWFCQKSSTGSTAATWKQLA